MKWSDKQIDALLKLVEAAKRAWEIDGYLKANIGIDLLYPVIFDLLEVPEDTKERSWRDHYADCFSKMSSIDFLAYKLFEADNNWSCRDIK